MDDQGWLYFKGRKKDLIVLANGQNVYPDDIENLLKKQPGVRDAPVIGLPREGGAVEVHAVLLLEEGTQAPELVRSVNGQLAAHQQVQGFTVWPLEDLPRTHTLKVKKGEVLEFIQQMKAGSAGPPQETPEAEAGSSTPLVRLLGGLSPVDAWEIGPESTLGGDLNLDSLGRVELLSAIEQELGVSIDDGAISPDTTVGELERLVAETPPGASGFPFAHWPMQPIICLVREVAHQVALFPLYHLLWKIRVEGRERLNGLPQPALIAPNHNFGAGTFGLDPMAAWMGLPRALRLRTCTAGAADDVFGDRKMGFLARFVGNAFPLSREGNVRASLEYVGRVIDLGWSVLIFPEGWLTTDGPIKPFKTGIGLIAVESGLHVVPMKIEVAQKSILQGRLWPPRGAVTISVGEPLSFSPGTPYAEATTAIEAAVHALGAGLYLEAPRE